MEADLSVGIYQVVEAVKLMEGGEPTRANAMVASFDPVELHTFLVSALLLLGIVSDSAARLVGLSQEGYLDRLRLLTVRVALEGDKG